MGTVANVVGAIVVFAISAVVPILLARAALSLVIGLMFVSRAEKPSEAPVQSGPTQDDHTSPAPAGAV
jgi:hypothetical protein